MWHFGWHSMWGFGAYPVLMALFLPLFVWSIVWKAMVFWVTARRGDILWFIIISSFKHRWHWRNNLSSGDQRL